MNRTRSLLGIGIVVLLCAFALASLFQHSLSIRLARESDRLTVSRRVLRERVESLEVELVKRQTFCRLDSVWQTAGRPETLPGFFAAGPDSIRPTAPAEIAKGTSTR